MDYPQLNTPQITADNEDQEHDGDGVADHISAEGRPGLSLPPPAHVHAGQVPLQPEGAQGLALNLVVREAPVTVPPAFQAPGNLVGF